MALVPSNRPSFILAEEILVSITCVLSMVGSGLIITTFVAFKNLRTNSRQILVQLSIADFFVAFSHLLGVTINLPKYDGLIRSHHDEDDINQTSDTFCEIQGGMSVFFTLSSFLWTIAVAVYLLTIIVFENHKVGRRLTYAFYPICWGLAAVIVIVFVFLHYLGFHANVDAGTYAQVLIR